MPIAADALAGVPVRGKLNAAWVDRQSTHRAALPGSTLTSVPHGSAAMPKANRSDFPGVTWDRRHGKWMVQIRLGHRNVRLGYLDDFDDARRVYVGAKVLPQAFDQPFAVSFACPRSGPSTG